MGWQITNQAMLQQLDILREAIACTEVITSSTPSDTDLATKRRPELLNFLKSESVMETVLSVLLGELVSRSINFFISKSSKLKIQDVEDSLQKVLLRAEVIINEATGRHITSAAMLQQLNMLRDTMYQGNYILDTFRYQSNNSVEDAKDPVVSHSFPLTKLNSLKRIYSSNRPKSQILEPLQDALNNLNSMILDVKELVAYLTSYPCLYRQPYSMHLLLSNYMFGREMEAQFVISFLLNRQPHGSEELEVLPIVGPYRVGKSTLVSHVCMYESVRDHFSEILFLDGHDFTYYDLTALTKACAMEHQDNVLTSNKDRRLLVVVELVGDVNEDAWNRFCSFCKQRLPMGSKIVVTSRSDKIVKFGTTSPLCLKYMPHEEYWYFFKTLTFETIDPRMHPRFAHVAMEIAGILSFCLIGANLTASLLRTNFDIRFWYKVLNFIRGSTQNNISKHGRHPFHLINQKKPPHCWRMTSPSKDLVLYCDFERPSHEEAPRIRIQDVMFGKARPHGKFELLSWRSRIPPYYSYVASCEIRERKTTTTKKKSSTN